MSATAPTGGATKWLLVISAITGGIVFEFTWTISGVALPHMQGAFSATTDQIAWVMTAFVMGASISIICMGWLSTRFGRKRMFIVSIAGFTLTLVMCALSSTLLEQSIWRFLQGLLGAGLMPLSQAITMDAYPPEKRGQATALWGNGVVLGGIMGPVIGGVMVEYFSWPGIYWLNVPIGLVALVGVVFFIPETETEPDRRLDWIGLFAIVAAMATLQLLLNRGERLDWFESPEIVVQTLVVAFALYIYAAHSATTSGEPFLRRELFKDTNFVLGLGFITVNGALSILPLVLLPLMLQNIGGYPVISAGGLLVARGVGLVVGLTLVGHLACRADNRYILAIGFLGMFVSGWGMSVWTVEVPRWEVVWTNLLQGASTGIIFVTITALTFSTLRARLQTEAMSVFHAIFFVGSALGVAGIMAIHARTAQISHAVLSEHISPLREVFGYSFVPNLWDLESLSGLAALDGEIVRQATMIAYNNTFFSVAATSLLAVPLVFLFRKESSTTS